eukprot:scaffold38062_cov194-Skeletonema_dohrnii-CCMP3373.AAC.4
MFTSSSVPSLSIVLAILSSSAATASCFVGRVILLDGYDVCEPAGTYISEVVLGFSMSTRTTKVITMHCRAFEVRIYMPFAIPIKDI